MSAEPPETCCGLFVSHFRDRYVCPRCGDVWVWDEDAVEWIPTTRIDGGGA